MQSSILSTLGLGNLDPGIWVIVLCVCFLAIIILIVMNSKNKKQITILSERIDALTSGEDGKLNGEFTGLADGTYTLVEKTTPSGYNTAEDKEITIAKGDYSAGNLKQEATVINKAGSVLPATGGIGTTLFYVVGSVLVIGAAVVLISKRRMTR